MEGVKSEDSDIQMSAEGKEVFRVSPPQVETSEMVAFQALSSLSSGVPLSRGYTNFLHNRNFQGLDHSHTHHSHTHPFPHPQSRGSGANFNWSSPMAMSTDGDWMHGTSKADGKEKPEGFERVKIACSACKASKTKCDSGSRPCGRCVRLGRGDKCVDAIQKKRGRKRGEILNKGRGKKKKDSDELFHPNINYYASSKAKRRKKTSLPERVEEGESESDDINESSSPSQKHSEPLTISPTPRGKDEAEGERTEEGADAEPGGRSMATEEEKDQQAQQDQRTDHGDELSERSLRIRTRTRKYERQAEPRKKGSTSVGGRGGEKPESVRELLSGLAQECEIQGGVTKRAVVLDGALGYVKKLKGRVEGTEMELGILKSQYDELKSQETAFAQFCEGRLEEERKKNKDLETKLAAKENELSLAKSHPQAGSQEIQILRREVERQKEEIKKKELELGGYRVKFQEQEKTLLEQKGQFAALQVLGIPTLLQNLLSPSPFALAALAQQEVAVLGQLISSQSLLGQNSRSQRPPAHSAA